MADKASPRADRLVPGESAAHLPVKSHRLVAIRSRRIGPGSVSTQTQLKARRRGDSISRADAGCCANVPRWSWEAQVRGDALLQLSRTGSSRVEAPSWTPSALVSISGL